MALPSAAGRTVSLAASALNTVRLGGHPSRLALNNAQRRLKVFNELRLRLGVRSIVSRSAGGGGFVEACEVL